MIGIRARLVALSAIYNRFVSIDSGFILKFYSQNKNLIIFSNIKKKRYKIIEVINIETSDCMLKLNGHSKEIT
jgi:hypothetical protein